MLLQTSMLDLLLLPDGHLLSQALLGCSQLALESFIAII